MSSALDFLISHPQILLGVVAGILVTVFINAVRRIRRLITTGIVLAIAGGSATSITTLEDLLAAH